MALVEAEHSARPVPLGGDDHAEVSQAHVQVPIAAWEVGEHAVVTRFEVGDDEPAGGEVLYEAEASTPP